MNTGIHIEGFAEMVKALDKLPDKMQKQAILKIERKSTKPLINSARSKLLSHGSNYKNLASSIGNITAKSKNPIIYAGPRVKGKYASIGYTAHWVEYGTSGIVSQKNRKNTGYKRASDDPKFTVWVGKIKKGGRYRADQPANPFMRPAIDEKQREVGQLFVKNMHVYLDEIIRKSVAKLKR